MTAEPIGLPVLPGVDVVVALVRDAYTRAGHPSHRVTVFPDLAGTLPVTVVQGPVGTITVPVDPWRPGAGVRSETTWQVDVHQRVVDETGVYVADDSLAAALAVTIPGTHVTPGDGRVVHRVTVVGPTRYPAGPADGDTIRDLLTVTVTEMVGTPAV